MANVKSRVSFKKVQGGNVEGGGTGGFSQAVERYTFDSTAGVQKVKIIIPSLENQPLLYELPFHKLNKKSQNVALEMPKKDGGTYTPFEFGCISHVVQRPGALKDELKKLKEEDGITCPLCDIFYAENRKFYKWVEEEYPNFDELTGKQKNEVYKEFEENHRTVYPSYEVRDGEFIISAKRRLIVAVLDEFGKYQLKYMDVSLKRLEDIQGAIADAVDSGIYPEDEVESFTNLNGELEYNITDVELLLTYPKGTKIEAGRNLKISVIAEAKSRSIQDKELVERIKTDLASKVDAIDKQMDNDYHLKQRSHEEVMEFINKDYYEDLIATYPPKPYEPKEDEKGEDKPKQKTTKSSKKAKAKEETEEVESAEDLFSDL